MNELSDQELLRDYAERQSEPAFAELVRRHIDFVYSAALRMVCDPHTAEDVTQNTFIALTKNPLQVRDRSVLSSWLHSTARNLAANAIRTEVRRREREQEAAIMSELLANEPEAVWKNIAPHLDDAITELGDSDRDALLLRFFERKSAREMGQIFGTSEEAAQKRVSRAVERLRKFFSNRGIAVGTGGLVILISTNAVQSAPITLTASVSTAVLTGTTVVHSSTTITATKAIAMTALQKTIVTATLAIVAATGIYEAHQATELRKANQTLQQQQTSLAGKINQLQQERDDATNQLTSLADQLEKTKNNDLELLKLRGQVALLQNELTKQTAVKTTPNNDAPNKEEEPSYQRDAALLTHYFETNPSQQIPEMKLLPKDYIASIYGLAVKLAAQNDPTNYGIRGVFDENRIKLETDQEYRAAASELRSYAEYSIAPTLVDAFKEYLQANNGAYPKLVSDLQPFLTNSMDPAILQRYNIQPASNFQKIQLKYASSSRLNGNVITQTAPIDEEFDHRILIGPNHYLVGDSGSFKP